MKRAVFIYTGSSPTGGLVTYFENIFASAPKKKIDLRLISVGHWESLHRIQRAGGHVDIVHGFFGMIYRIILEKPDTLISAGVKSTFYARLVSLFTGTPLITTVHSDFRYDYPAGIKKSIFFALDRMFRFKTKKYITVSEYLKNRLIADGVNSDRIEVVSNGVLFPEDKKETPPKALKGSIVIGSVGRLHSTKGFDILIKAMQSIPESVSLKIWGEGAERNALEKLISTLGLSGRVSLMGQTEDIQEALKAISIYVQPSRMEGFGLALVEAMGFGLPVIVMPVGSLTEIVIHKKTGLVSKDVTSGALAIEINRLLGDMELASKLGDAASKDVRKRFSLEESTRRLVECILN